MGWSSCCLRDSQVSPSARQVQSLSSLALSLLYHWTLTSIHWLSSVQFIQSFLTICDHMEHRIAGLPVHRQHPESTQTHAHWVCNTIQPSHLLSSPCPLAFNISQDQGLFQWVSSSHQVDNVLEFQLQHQSLKWTPRTDLFKMDWLYLLQSKGFSEFSPASQFKNLNYSVLSFLHSPTLTSIYDSWENHWLD